MYEMSSVMAYANVVRAIACWNMLDI
jgi:hypothetical protein